MKYRKVTVSIPEDHAVTTKRTHMKLSETGWHTMSLEKAMHKKNRSIRDFYQTPDICVHALCDYLPPDKNVSILDPCAGQMVIPKVLIKNGYQNVRYTDLYSGPEYLRVNFLDITAAPYDMIIMNPPFGQKKDFILHALKMVDTVYCLLSMQVVNFNDFSREILSLPEYRGRLKMVPKFFMTEEPQPGIPKLGGNAQYAWFVFSKTEFMDFNISGVSLEIQIDLIEIAKKIGMST